MFQTTSSLRVVARNSTARPSYVATAQRSVVAPRLFSVQSRLRVKEDANRSPEELEATKQSQLDKQKKGEGHWHEELASSGEANIAADKHDVKDHDDHMDDLQKQTAGKAEKEHPHGKA